VLGSVLHIHTVSIRKLKLGLLNSNAFRRSKAIPKPMFSLIINQYMQHQKTDFWGYLLHLLYSKEMSNPISIKLGTKLLSKSQFWHFSSTSLYLCFFLSVHLHSAALSFHKYLIFTLINNKILFYILWVILS
jgi:hypothetical protein